MRARDRLGVIAGVYGLRLLLSAGLALPVASLVEGSGMNQFGEGDALLFEPSGLFLLEFLRVSGSELQALARNSFFLLLFAMAVLIAARAAEMTALARPGKLELGSFLERSLRAVPTFLLVSGIGLLARLLVVGAGAWAVDSLIELLIVRTGERTADLAGWGLGLAFLVPLAGISIVADLGRASVVLERSGIRDALLRGVSLLRRHGAFLAAVWAALVLASLGLVVVGAVVTAALDVSKPGGLRLFGVFALHQAIAFGLVFLDAVWLTKALGAVSPPPLADTPEHSDAPPDPSSDPAASLDA